MKVTPLSSPSFTSIDLWNYRETGTPPQRHMPNEEAPEATAPPPPGIAEAEVIHRIQEALQQARQQWDSSASEKQHARNQKLISALQEFTAQRTLYFRQVENEIVHLTLAIVRKILRREASIDPTLLCGLVRIALDDIAGEDAVRLRVPSTDVAAWKLSQSATKSLPSFDLVEDPRLEPDDAVLETHIGSANIGFEAQLKLVEQGFLDLLAHRPEQA